MQEIIEKENIKDMIYEIRGVQVILDSDLAEIYHCTNGTKDINKAVKRNINRFPSDFYFQLTKEECYGIPRFHFGTLKEGKGHNIKYLPYAFTEQGVAMLASVLHTSVAEEASVRVMRAFVKLRKIIRSNLLEQQYINELVLEHDKDIKLLQETFNKFNENEKTNLIFFEGEIYDAYSILMDMLSISKEEIIIIDNYAGKELLDILKDINKNVIIVSSNISEVLKKKYESQYSNIKFINNTSFHDRFIIIDRKILYSCGASFKDLGKKCFSINLSNNRYIVEIISKIFK